jgi:hypothetical protein
LDKKQPDGCPIKDSRPAFLAVLSKPGIIMSRPYPIRFTMQRKGVDALDILLDFLVSVGASIIGNYVGKWLDRYRKGR